MFVECRAQQPARTHTCMRALLKWILQLPSTALCTLLLRL
jgi:hypothetical protein